MIHNHNGFLGRMAFVFWFLAGAACFIVSQPLLRMPILERLQQSTGFLLAYALNPLLVGILIALSAGVFEEGFRFLFKQIVLKPNKCRFSQPVIFGLGHGLTEALIVLVPALMVVPVSQLSLAFLERVLAVVLHVALSVIVWNGFQKKQRVLYLLIAIAIHGFVNSLIPVLTPLSNSILLIEVSLAVIDVFLVIYIYYSKKYYTRRRNENEEIKI
jgi:uncharacterized membrane protein YhfC